MKKHKLSLKGLLGLSGAAFLVLNAPAWGQGLAVCAAACCILWIWLWKAPLRDSLWVTLKNPAYFIFGTAACTTFAFNFYTNWYSSQIIAKICRMLHIAPMLFLMAIACLLALLSAPIAACLIGACTPTVRKLFSGKSEKGKVNAGLAFAILFACFAVGISALLRANVYYQDDGSRAVWGYKQWDYFGRYLSTGLATWVHSGHYLADAAPLPQLLACAVLAFAGVIALAVLTGRKAFSLWEVAAVVPLGLNPYFLGCYSFRFDAPYMAVSVLMGVWPVLYRKDSPHKYVAVSALGALGVCCTYQAGTGIFPMLVAVVVFQMWKEKDSLAEIGRFLGYSVLGFGLGLVLFKLMLMRPANAGYVSNDMFPLAQLVSGTAGNLGIYWRAVWNDFNGLWRVLSGGVLLSFLVRGCIGSKQPKWATLLVSLVMLLCMALLAFGLYPLLQNTLFAARAMYGVGVGLSFLAVCAAENEGHYPAKMAALLLSGAFFVFAFIYGNALNFQKTYSDFRMEQVIADVAELYAGETPADIQITGSVDICRTVQHEIAVYPVLNRLVIYNFDNSEFFLERVMAGYNPRLNVDDSSDFSRMSLVKDTMYHSIYSDGSRFLITLK